MRQHQTISIQDVFSKATEFSTIIDVRSPSEFADDHLPGSINLPVLTDVQRHDVGLRHKEEGAFAGSRFGAPLVARNIAEILENHLIDMPRTWQPLVYCWRGGQRSNSLATILARVGWRTHLLDGGYKAYRRFVIDSLANPPALSFNVITGRTGSAKSLVLQALADLGEQVLDLEQLAHHKGSVLGDLPNVPQPSQRLFESRLASALRSFDPFRVVYVESESKKVGKVHIPDQLMTAIRAGAVTTVRASLDWRVQFLLSDYDYFVKNTGPLFAQIDCLAGLHGKNIISRWKDLALEGRWDAFVGALLSEHYDPAYDRAIDKNYANKASGEIIELTDLNFKQAAQHAALQIRSQTVSQD